jgi:hypothetical protein
MREGRVGGSIWLRTTYQVASRYQISRFTCISGLSATFRVGHYKYSTVVLYSALEDAVLQSCAETRVQTAVFPQVDQKDAPLRCLAILIATMKQVVLLLPI